MWVGYSIRVSIPSSESAASYHKMNMAEWALCHRSTGSILCMFTWSNCARYPQRVIWAWTFQPEQVSKNSKFELRSWGYIPSFKYTCSFIWIGTNGGLCRVLPFEKGDDLCVCQATPYQPLNHNPLQAWLAVACLMRRELALFLDIPLKGRPLRNAGRQKILGGYPMNWRGRVLVKNMDLALS